MFVLIILSFLLGANAVKFTIKNNAGGRVWIGIQGNSGQPTLENGGFVLEQNQERVVTSASNWAGRFWARSWCNDQTKHCETGDCGNKVQCAGNGGAPPATLVEITLKGWGNKDYYDISLVDGFNLKASIRPVGGSGDCKAITCANDLNPNCPNELRLFGSSGVIIGCKSSCLAFNTDQCCCRGSYGTPQTCKDMADCKPVNSAKYFKANCPDAYSYAYDDSTSTFTCSSETYYMTFG